MGYGNVLLRSEGRRVSGEEARRVREEAHLSQREIAAVLGVSPAAISRWETGVHLPRGVAAERYARLIRALKDAEAA